MIEVKWHRRNKISNEMIIKIENELNITFPADFKKFILEHSGARPIPHTFDFKGRVEAVINNVFHFDLSKEYNVLEEYGFVKDRFINDVYPFARDPFGNLICFDFRKDKENPSVVFWDHEIPSDDPKNYQFIANSFTEFIDKLYEA